MKVYQDNYVPENAAVEVPHSGDAREPQLQAATNVLESQIKELMHAVDALSERLQPVMSPPRPVDSRGMDGPDLRKDVLCSLAVFLNTRSSDIGVARQRVFEIIDRLEL